MSQTQQVADLDEFPSARHHLPADLSANLRLGDLEISVLSDPLSETHTASDLILSAARVSVVMPALNEEDNLAHVFARMPRFTKSSWWTGTRPTGPSNWLTNFGPVLLRCTNPAKARATR